ncbi:MAG: hypothetical protein VB093_19605 [Propionicimonas sp.]|nr:hypothetical protein [Propionicimonas sp.]
MMVAGRIERLDRQDVIEEVAQIIAKSRDAMRPAPLLDESLYPTWDEVWPIERRVEAIRARTIAGWKVGAASKEIRQLEGMPGPILGSLHAGTIQHSGARLDSSLFINHRVCEAEFVVRLGQDLPLLDREFEPGDLDAVIDFVYAGLEVGDLVFADWDACTKFWGTCIDNAGGAQLVIGSGRPYRQGESLAEAPVSIHANGELIREGTGYAAMGDPIVSATWVANRLREDGRQLEKGIVISTGTCTGHYFAQPGDRVTATFPGIGEGSAVFG